MVEEYQMLEDLNEIKEDIYMALFGNGNRSNFTFFDESIDDFVINEFDAGANATEDNDDEDDIQGLDDNEVDDEGETPDEPDTQTDDTPEEPVNDNPEDDTDAQEDDGIEGMDDSEVGDDTGEEPTADNPTDDNTDPATDEPDAGGDEDDALDTIDDDSDGMDDMGDGSGDTGEDTDDDLGGDDNGDSLDSSENDPHQRLKELEAEIFDQLSEPEKQMKINELKKLYGLLIDKADSLYKLTQEISKTDDTVKMIDYTLNTLMDLKTYMKDYVIDVFDNRTYLQNSVNFQKFLTIFDAVHSIFKEIKKQLESDDKN